MFSQSVQIMVQVIKNPDGTFSVRLLRWSSVLVDGQPVRTSEPTEFGKKDFPTQSEADLEAQRVASYFNAQLSYP